MPKASRSTIRRAADLLIGENLMGLRAVNGSELPACERLAYAPSCPDHRSRLQKKTTSNSTQSRVLHTNEEKRFNLSWAPYRRIMHWRQWNRWSYTVRLIPVVRRRSVGLDYLSGATFGWHCLAQASKRGSLASGPRVTAALRAFDAQYLAGLRPPAKTENYRSARSASSAAV